MKASTSIKVLAAAVMLASTTGVALAKNYKGEANYKDMPACPPPVMLKDGFYLGAQLGYDSWRVRETITEPADSDLTANPAISNTGWTGGLFLGYGQYLTDLFYLGGEVLGNVNGSSHKYRIADAGDAETYNNKFTTNGTWGLALIPGIRLNDTSLGYIRLGWNWTGVKVKESVVDVTTVSTSRSRTINGFDLGVGIETLLVTNWSLRTEYNHTWYSSFRSSNNNNFGTKFSPSNNQFMLGLLYHFS